MCINEWSDDFEPHVSIMGNCGSLWVKCIMIKLPHDELHSLSHIYSIAIGYKGSSHEAVEQKFANKELLDLSSGTENWFYHGELKANVQVHMQLFTSLQDQP